MQKVQTSAIQNIVSQGAIAVRSMLEAIARSKIGGVARVDAAMILVMLRTGVLCCNKRMPVIAAEPKMVSIATQAAARRDRAERSAASAASSARARTLPCHSEWSSVHPSVSEDGVLRNVSRSFIYGSPGARRAACVTQSILWRWPCGQKGCRLTTATQNR